jgi:chromosomal replication initiation ATPase DnaA
MEHLVTTSAPSLRLRKPPLTKRTRAVDFDRILSIVGAQYEVTRQEILSEASHRRISYPRKIIMYLAYVDTSLLLKQIAWNLNRKQSTVQFGVHHLHSQLSNICVREEIAEIRFKY